MKSSQEAEVLIIGAGIIGLSIGIAILESRPSTSVRIVEKEQAPGLHASGRNSGVIHAGFYYSPDSLKAKFCREGNFELRRLCTENDIPVHRIGKVVVARNKDEDSRLELLYSRGISNGVDLELLHESKLSRIEPLAKTHNRFLWSPNTAISDPRAVSKAMVAKFDRLGGKIDRNYKVKLEVRGNEVFVDGYKAKLVVNSAGAQSDRLARRLGLAREFAMVPFMGMYRTVPIKSLPIKRLIYPVPHPINPFLGVHFTLTLDGKVKIGPTAIPILGREQYSPLTGWSLPDMGQALVATAALIRGEAHDFGEILKSEIPKLREKSLVSASATLVPDALKVRGWQKALPGIRSQLVNVKAGKLEQDFIVESFHNSVHILNAVSPGWTSSLPFGRWVASEKILPNM